MTPPEIPGRDVTNQAGIAVINSAAAAELSATLKLMFCYFKWRETARKFTGHACILHEQFLKVLKSLVSFLP